MGRPCKDQRRGTSLLELVVVLLLIGLIAAMVSVQTKGQLGRAEFESELDRLVTTLGNAMRWSDKFDQPCEVILHGNRVVPTSKRKRESLPSNLLLRQCTIARIETLDRKRVAKINVVPNGSNATYVVYINSRDNNLRAYVILVALTGDIRVLKTEHELQQFTKVFS